VYARDHPDNIDKALPVFSRSRGCRTGRCSPCVFLDKGDRGRGVVVKCLCFPRCQRKGTAR